MKKCRARYGLDQQSQWCKPCRYVCRVYFLLTVSLSKRRPRVHNADHLRAYRKSVLSRCCRRLSPSETGSAGGTLPFAIVLAERNVEFRVTIARYRSTDDAFAATRGLRSEISLISLLRDADVRPEYSRTRGVAVQPPCPCSRRRRAVSSTSGCPVSSSTC